MTALERIRYRQRMKKIRTIKKALTLSVISLLLIGAFALMFNVIESTAQDKNAVNTYKYFTSVTVGYGDTLYTLAEENTKGHDIEIHDYIKEVIHINHLDDEMIQSGQSLIIPYYSEELKGI